MITTPVQFAASIYLQEQASLHLRLILGTIDTWKVSKFKLCLVLDDPIKHPRGLILEVEEAFLARSLDQLFLIIHRMKLIIPPEVLLVGLDHTGLHLQSQINFLFLILIIKGSESEIRTHDEDLIMVNKRLEVHHSRDMIQLQVVTSIGSVKVMESKIDQVEDKEETGTYPNDASCVNSSAAISQKLVLSQLMGLLAIKPSICNIFFG